MTLQKTLEEDLKTHNRQMESELELAKSLQQTFLPQSYPEISINEGGGTRSLRFAHLYKPSFTLGGDFLSVLQAGEHKVAVLLCDVMGHGVRAALVTAMLRAITSELQGIADSPAKFLSQMNRLLAESLSGGNQLLFATAFYGVVDLKAMTVTYVNAGSNCVMLARGISGIVSKLDREHDCGPALGFFPDHVYEAHQLDLQPGDEVIAYTDGIVEASDGQSAYGESRMSHFISEYFKMKPDQRFNHLVKDVQKYSGSSSFEDDICLFTVKVVTGS
jgi:sigma-B regulation protein RsbU (phosphoserine phosphatase)